VAAEQDALDLAAGADSLAKLVIAKGVITVFNKEGLENRRWVYFNVHLRHAPNQVQKIVREALVGTPNVSMRTPPGTMNVA